MVVALGQRASGILLHPTSLPGPQSIGDLGKGAYAFADFLAEAGQRWWQMLPVGPQGIGNSPYDSPSAFAGSALLINLERLVDEGLLNAGDVLPTPRQDSVRVDYNACRAHREPLLRRAFGRFVEIAAEPQRAELRRFEAKNRSWLRDHALFQAFKNRHNQAHWTTWPAAVRDRRPEALTRACRELADEISYHVFLQYLFERDWNALRGYCDELGIALLGDVPMFVAHDGADAWAHQELFFLNRSGQPTVIAGVPPDYFSEDGQRWGNPLYRWNRHRATGYAWWIARLKKGLERFDALRLDHFIGFYRYWEIPASAPTAREGRFVKVPGHHFLKCLREALGGLPFIAEDLGLLTPEVHALRDEYGLPGMRVLQFAFDEGSEAYQPHRFTARTVVYTGTHDNDTTSGWLTPTPGRAGAEQRKKRALALAYAGSDGTQPHWDMVRLAMMSVADLAIVPLQDILGLGSDCRMNIPGTMIANWGWRVNSRQLTQSLAKRMAKLCQLYER